MKGVDTVLGDLVGAGALMLTMTGGLKPSTGDSQRHRIKDELNLVIHFL